MNQFQWKTSPLSTAGRGFDVPDGDLDMVDPRELFSSWSRREAWDTEVFSLLETCYLGALSVRGGKAVGLEKNFKARRSTLDLSSVIQLRIFFLRVVF